jgi:hypothetical protein
MNDSSLAMILFAASFSLPVLAIDRDNNLPGLVWGSGSSPNRN